MNTKKPRREGSIQVHRHTVRKAGVLAAIHDMTIGELVEAMIDERYAAAELPKFPETRPTEAIAS